MGDTTASESVLLLWCLEEGDVLAWSDIPLLHVEVRLSASCNRCQIGGQMHSKEHKSLMDQASGPPSQESCSHNVQPACKQGPTAFCQFVIQKLALRGILPLTVELEHGHRG